MFFLTISTLLFLNQPISAALGHLESTRSSAATCLLELTTLGANVGCLGNGRGGDYLGGGCNPVEKYKSRSFSQGSG